MHTLFPLVDLEDFPISCTVCLSEEGVIGTGKVWAFYPASCHVESALAITPGMMVTLSLHLPGIARITLKSGLVTWARESEFGLRFMPRPVNVNQERMTL